jgi:hypothetical protein
MLCFARRATRRFSTDAPHRCLQHVQPRLRARSRHQRPRSAHPHQPRGPDGQRHPRPGDGRGAAGQQRPPGGADGHGRDCGRTVGPPSEAQPVAPALAGPRPLCALQWPRLDAAVRAAAPQRLRVADERAAQLPPVAQQDAGAPRGRHHARCRNHHRPAGAGPTSSTGRAMRWSITTPMSFSATAA